MCGIFEIYTPDININYFGNYILLLIVKLNHKHRKHFKHQCNYIVLKYTINMIVYIDHHILEVKPLNFFINSGWPATYIRIMINFVFKEAFLSFFNLYLYSASSIFYFYELKRSGCLIKPRRTEVNLLKIHSKVSEIFS